jgi:hypothetical protein
MSDFFLFVCGIVVTLIAGLGIITSQVFSGYQKFIKSQVEQEKQKVFDF